MHLKSYRWRNPAGVECDVPGSHKGSWSLCTIIRSWCTHGAHYQWNMCRRKWKFMGASSTSIHYDRAAKCYNSYHRSECIRWSASKLQSTIARILTRRTAPVVSSSHEWRKNRNGKKEKERERQRAKRTFLVPQTPDVYFICCCKCSGRNPIESLTILQKVCRTVKNVSHNGRSGADKHRRGDSADRLQGGSGCLWVHSSC